MVEFVENVENNENLLNVDVFNIVQALGELNEMVAAGIVVDGQPVVLAQLYATDGAIRGQAAQIAIALDAYYELIDDLPQSPMKIYMDKIYQTCGQVLNMLMARWIPFTQKFPGF